MKQEEITSKTRRKRDKLNPIPNKEAKEEQSQKIKLPESIIYDPLDIGINQQGNIQSVEEKNNIQDYKLVLLMPRKSLTIT